MSSICVHMYIRPPTLIRLFSGPDQCKLARLRKAGDVLFSGPKSSMQ